MSFLYTIGIWAYTFAIRIAALFNTKAQKWVKGRANWELFFEQGSFQNQPVIWFHCASLGEFEQGRPVMEAFKKQFPSYKILLTFFSPSGYEVRKNYDGADWICYLPADTPTNAQRFVALAKPSLAVFVKYEFWYHYFQVLHTRQIPILSISTIFRENQSFFKWYGGFYRGILQLVTHFFVQNQTSLQLLQGIGIKHVTLAGDTRFDRVKQIADARKEISLVKSFKANSLVFVVGSCWNEDLDVLLPLINHPSYLAIKWIIAPHEIHHSEIERWKNSIKRLTTKYSELLTNESLSNSEVIIIDNVGMLSSLYQYADFAWIGGAYGKGLHNILEAATFGLPIFFGNKNYRKFQEATDLIEAGIAWAIQHAEELFANFKPLYDNEELRKQKATISSHYVSSKTGATALIAEFVKNLLHQSKQNSSEDA